MKKEFKHLVACFRKNKILIAVAVFVMNNTTLHADPPFDVTAGVSVPLLQKTKYNLMDGSYYTLSAVSGPKYNLVYTHKEGTLDYAVSEFSISDNNWLSFLYSLQIFHDMMIYCIINDTFRTIVIAGNNNIHSDDTFQVSGSLEFVFGIRTVLNVSSARTIDMDYSYLAKKNAYNFHSRISYMPGDQTTTISEDCTTNNIALGILYHDTYRIYAGATSINSRIEYHDIYAWSFIGGSTMASYSLERYGVYQLNDIKPFLGLEITTRNKVHIFILEIREPTPNKYSLITEYRFRFSVY